MCEEAHQKRVVRTKYLLERASSHSKGRDRGEEGGRGGGRRSRVQGKRFREELLRQSDRAQSRVLILVRKETSPAIERVPISPPHLLRIVALSRQPDLHGECTYGRLYRGPYEKRDATLAFAEKKGKKK